MIIRNYRIESVDTEFRSDNILIFDFKNKSIISKIFYKIFKIFGKPVTSREFIVKERLDDKDIVRYIYEQQALLQHFAKRAPKYLILGHDAMQELKMRTTYGSFTVGESFDEGYIRNRFAGLNVILVPTMSGALVLHDICPEARPNSGDNASVSSVSSITGV
jgi:hypothetical protein